MKKLWTIDDFENGATAMLIIKVKVNEIGEYHNKAIISGEQTDIVKTNNDITSSISVLTYFTVESNSYFSVKDGVLYDKNSQTLLNFPNGKSGSFSIPEGVAKIGESAFAYSNKLTSVTIPNSVITINNYAFLYCDALTTVTITGSVKTIGQYAFGYNSSFTSVIINSVDPPVTYRPFYNCPKLKLIDLPNASLDVYKATTGWSDYKDVLM